MFAVLLLIDAIPPQHEISFYTEAKDAISRFNEYIKRYVEDGFSPQYREYSVALTKQLTEGVSQSHNLFIVDVMRLKFSKPQGI